MRIEIILSHLITYKNKNQSISHLWSKQKEIVQFHHSLENQLVGLWIWTQIAQLHLSKNWMTSSLICKLLMVIYKQYSNQEQRVQKDFPALTNLFSVMIRDFTKHWFHVEYNGLRYLDSTNRMNFCSLEFVEVHLLWEALICDYWFMMKNRMWINTIWVFDCGVMLFDPTRVVISI